MIIILILYIIQRAATVRPGIKWSFPGHLIELEPYRHAGGPALVVACLVLPDLLNAEVSRTFIRLLRVLHRLEDRRVICALLDFIDFLLQRRIISRYRQFFYII